MEEVRISRILSEYYQYTRKEAEELIHEGRVELNGRKAASGDKAVVEDTVTLDGINIPLKGIFRTVARDKANQKASESVNRQKHSDGGFDDDWNPKSKKLRQGRKNEHKKRRGKNNEDYYL